MIVGYEWIIDAAGCDADALRDAENLRSIFASVISDLQLKTIGEAAWHKFGGEGGITGLVMLTESHLACHTYPEHNAATFNLYCCRERPYWNWEENLREKLGAESIKIQKVERGNRNAGILPAVPEASRFQTNFPKVTYGEVKIRNRGRLPHWEKEDGIYFVTFRLADSLPQEILQKLNYERDLNIKVLEKLDRKISIAEKKKIDFLFSEKLEEYLDSGYGSCVLKNDEIAKIVMDSLLHFNNARYFLYGWCVMPNHVHVIVRPLADHQLSDILQSWKSFSAKKINQALGESGKLWQREYYDRLIRNQEEFARIIQYVADNPQKAGLQGWKWVDVKRMSARRAQDSRQDVGAVGL